MIETYKWLVKREKQLLKQLNQIEQELQDIPVVRDYLKKHFFEKEVQKIFNNYLLHIEAYCNCEKINIDDEQYDPDESFMRRIEESIGISENAKMAFREEILIRLSAYQRKGKVFDYTSHERLREAVEKVILQ